METLFLRVMRELLLLRVLSSWRAPRGTPRRWAGWRVERGWFAQVRAQFHVEHADAMGVLNCAASKRSTWNVGGRSGTPTRRMSVPQFLVAPHHVFHVERGRGSSKRTKPRGSPLLGLPVHGCVGRLARARSTLLVPRGTRTCGVYPCVCAVHRQFHVERGHGSGANSRAMEELGRGLVRWRAFHVERGDPPSLVLASADAQRPSPCSIFQMARPAHLFINHRVVAFPRVRERVFHVERRSGA